MSIPTKLMKFFWNLEDLTHLPPFGWVGNWLEDNFRHEYNPSMIEGIRLAREQYERGEFTTLKTPEDIEKFVNEL